MMSTLRINLIAITLLALLLFLQYRLWFQSGGIADLWRLKKNLALQTEEILLLKKRNEALVFQIERLKHSQDATESRARSELGMIKKDEEFYQLVR